MAKKSISGKKRMSETQEFEIMKLVLDKFLWLGFIVMGWGMYQSLSQASVLAGIWYMIAGAILLLIFVVMIVKEYEIFK
ncbi:MAG: hypothetical protein ABH824_06040 [Nanoarchaeota archaeon]|nr:hypothetical protein [Nanoarchaeota archaeon]MBU1632578.1 hypothetical protein [Nanoarchaeota archaeon]MBU1875788.1 hypothetical protein [Nanoarchaeota archaeon]